MFWLMLIIAVILLACAFLIDRRNKRIKNSPLKTTNAHAKPGESTNFMMGDNRVALDAEISVGLLRVSF